MRNVTANDAKLFGTNSNCIQKVGEGYFHRETIYTTATASNGQNACAHGHTMVAENMKMWFGWQFAVGYDCEICAIEGGSLTANARHIDDGINAVALLVH